MRLLWYLTHCRVCSFSCFIWRFSHPRAHLTSTSFCRCCCFFKRKRKKNTPRQKWSRSTSLKRSSCSAQSIVILLEISKVPFRIEEGVIWEILIELFSVFWTSLKTVCWDVQDACVFLWDFFFVLFLLRPPPLCQAVPGCVAGQSAKWGKNLSDGILQRIIFFPSSPLPTSVFFSLFFSPEEEEMAPPVETCFTTIPAWLIKSSTSVPF